MADGVSDPTPVPLDDIDIERFQACGITPSEIRALCDALRIAVEGLDRVERWYVCKNVPDDDGDFITCRGFTDDSTGWCGWCCALDAIESVRELVDLGEKP